MSKNKKTSLKLTKIFPTTPSQEDFFEDFHTTDHFILSGYAGTGKTFCSLYLALREIQDKDTPYKKIIIVRSVVPTRDVGFLPGKLDEKMEVYELPYKNIFSELFNRGDAYGVMKRHKKVEFLATSYIRGTTMDDCIVVVDEAQNMNFHELDTIITRIGVNCKVMFCGDECQSDLIKSKYDKSGFNHLMRIAQHLPDVNSMGIIDFTEDDIVRSRFIKDYIITKNKLDMH